MSLQSTLYKVLELSEMRHKSIVTYKVSEIYERYGIPFNLQLHMVRSAAIGQLIFDHWRGPTIDQKMILTTLLLHDTGNIVKMDLDNQAPLAVGQHDRDDLKKRQQEIIAKYGADDHIVSMRIAEELGTSPRIVALIGQKTFVKNQSTVLTDDYELKITAYADQRIGPNGVLALADRFEEAKVRYNGRPNTSMNHPDVELFIKCAHTIEGQILSLTDLAPKDINDRTIKPLLASLFGYKIVCSV